MLLTHRWYRTCSDLLLGIYLKEAFTFLLYIVPSETSGINQTAFVVLHPVHRNETFFPGLIFCLLSQQL